MRRDLSVLIIQPWLNYRGAESVSIELCKELQSRGIRSRILCLYVSDAVADELGPEMVHVPNRVWQVFFKNKIFFILFGFWGMLLLGIIHGRKYEVYNPHNFPAVWVAVLCSIVYWRRVVWTVHNFPQHPFRGKVGTTFEFLISGIDSYLVHHVDTIVAVSQKVAALVHSKYDVTAEVVYPGIPVSFWQTNVSLDTSFEFSGKRILLHAGQIRPEKRQESSVALFNLIAQTCSELVLVFAGERISSHYPNLDLLPKNVRDRVFFTGRIPKEKLRSLYSNTEFLILQSHWGEGCNLVALEAMASGVAHVFVAKGSGVDELFDRYGKEIVFDSEQAIQKVASLIEQKYFEKRKDDYTNIVEISSFSHYTDIFLNILKG